MYNKKLTVVVLIIATVLLASNCFSQVISKERVTNVTSAAVTISWIGEADEAGIVNYGLSGGDLDQSTSAADDEAYAVSGHNCIGVHHVTISGLSAETAYDFQPSSDGETGDILTVTTPAPSGSGSNRVIAGYVNLADGTTRAKGAIKYLKIRKADGSSESQFRSLVTNDSGMWNDNLANFKTSDYSAAFSWQTDDIIEAYSEGGQSGTSPIKEYVIPPGTEPWLFDPDESLPVALSSFTASLSDQGIVVSWRTESEVNNLGFDVYRSESIDGKFVKINTEMIKGAGTVSTPHEYDLVDDTAQPGHSYYYYLKSIDLSGKQHQSHIIQITLELNGVLSVEIPLKSLLFQNYPNPFNPETWMPFQLAKPADVTISIYNLNGDVIRVLDIGHKDAGYYLSKDSAVYWDGKDQTGELVSSGVYFYTISAGDYHASKKLIIMK